MKLLAYEILDYFIQAVLFSYAFIWPWFTPRHRGWTVVVYPFLLAFVWTIWRVLSFDPLFHNAVPGIGYLFAAIMLAVIGGVFHRLRWVFVRNAPTPAAETHPNPR